MAKIRFETGQVVNFEGDPTQADIEEVTAQLNLKPSEPQESSSFLGPLLGKQKLGPVFGESIFGTEEEIQAGIKEVPGAITRGVSTGLLGGTEIAKEALGDIRGVTRPFFGEGGADFPVEQVTPFGKTARVGAEIAGLTLGLGPRLAVGTVKVVTKALTAGAKKFLPDLIPKIIGLGKQAVGTVQARKRAVLLRDALKGGLEGATFGAIQKPIDETVTRGEQAIAGGILGGAFPALRAGLRKGLRAFRKFKTPTAVRDPGKVITIKGEKELIAKGKEEAITETRAAKKGLIRQLKQEEVGLRAGAKEQIKLNKEFAQKELKETANTMRQNVAILNEGLQTTSEEKALQLQKVIPKFFKDHGKVYGQKVDEISEAMVARGEGITMNEASTMVNRSITEMNESLITEGVPRQVVEQLQRKYAVQQTVQKDVLTGIVKRATNANETIPFKELVNDLKLVKNSLSAGAKSGTTRFTQEEVAVSILNNNLGNYIKTRVPEYAELQANYAPIIRMMKKGNQIFKPFKGDFETKSATQFLKNLGLGKAEAGEEAFVKAIQEGSDFVPGLGDITAGVRKAGQEIIESKQRIQPVLDKIKSGALKRQEGIDRTLANNLEKLAVKKEFVNSSFTVKESLIKSEVAASLERIGFKEQEIKNLLKDKAKTAKVFSILFQTARTAALVGGALGIRRLGQFDR